MSQLQVTGEAKIRDIQGPVVANSGVITALDGDASQYVRGDGTLADFPTSTGGGSSVSYYLNSSVSQGTIGGVAYRELSKEPIIGAGTDIAISSNGYVASYITDVNDPDVVLIPGGNFNCEFYFSVNNNTGNPFFYAELYKYDGTTFTLLGSSVGVPEYITQGTTIAPYYFAIPVATATLALTDRLAIRIYVNVSGRTVTLHTENGHLCQVVTTLSKGMVSLNNLTDQSQFLTTGTSGTNFAIVSSGDTHTFNLPVASATNTGKLSSTDWSTFNGKVPYTGAIADVDLGSNNFTAFGGTFNSILTINATGNQARALYMVTGTAGSQYGSGTGVNLFSEATDNLSILFTTASTTRKAILNGANLTTAKTFTLPDASGTLALTSQLTGGTVTSVGLSSATSGVTIGSSPITTSGTITLAIATASGSQNGLLSSTDWTTFNNKYNLPSLTSGSVLFSNGTTIAQNNANFFWDNTNSFLGVGTNAPSAGVTSFSTTAATQLKAAGTAPAITFSNTLTSASLACVFGLATANNHFITGTAAGDMAIANQSTSAGAIVFGTGTFEKMRMSSGGNFGIGTSNPTSKLTVAGDATISAGTIAAFSFGVNSNSTFAFGSLNGRRAVIFAHETIGDSGLQFGWDTVDKTGIIAGSATSVGCGIDFYTFNGSSWGNRMRVTKDGNVGIGTSSPSNFTNYTTLSISGTNGGVLDLMYQGTTQFRLSAENGNNYITGVTNAPIIFAANNTERMRITSGGDLLVNTTTTSNASLYVVAKSNSDGIKSSVTTNGWTAFTALTPNTTCQSAFFICAGNTAGYISHPSTTTTTYYTGPSDLRLKSNINEWNESVLDLFSKIKPKTYNHIADNDESIIYKGFIAQEMVDKFPEAYQKDRDGYYANNPTGFIPYLVKAIQELTQKVNELESKIK